MSNVPKPGDHIMTFGVYRGKTLSEVAQCLGGADYMAWLLRESHVLDRVLRAAMKDFLKEDKGYVG